VRGVILDPRPSALDRAGFVTAYGGVYEHSPWIAEAAFDRGIGPADDTAGGLARALAAVVDAAPRAAKLALLRAHPDLAGRLAVAGGLGSASAAEQESAGLDRCTAEEFGRFSALNDAYRAALGFPFVLAVRGLTRAAILERFEARIGRDAEAEFATALAEVHRIARLRLDSMAREGTES
jgi:2-oxo-4-hydroxy-4-carboxy-5-ureidoimidazoline decarboxylase